MDGVRECDLRGELLLPGTVRTQTAGAGTDTGAVSPIQKHLQLVVFHRHVYHYMVTQQITDLG